MNEKMNCIKMIIDILKKADTQTCKEIFQFVYNYVCDNT